MAQFPMPTTLMPFLYQTRTIQRVARIRVNFARTNSSSSWLRCGLHTTARRARDEIPFELPSDVDLSRFDLPSNADAGLTDSITPTERQAFEKLFQDIAEGRHMPRLRKAPLPNPAKDELAPEASRLLAALNLGGPEDGPHGKKQDITSNINTIVGDAAVHQNKGHRGLTGLDPLSPLASTYSAADREIALLRFPPTLRRAARMAFGMIEGRPQVVPMDLDGEEVKVPVHQTSEQLERFVHIEARRKEERSRIEALMDACANDFELWDVIEKEILPLVGRLGITEKPRTPAPSLPTTPPKRGRKRKDKVPQVQVQPQEPEVQPQDLPELSPEALLIMEVYGPLYPQLLFKSLNMLDVQFSGPSPYATHVLPRVKDLGLVSYVLGVSTSFYNQLMSILWNRYGDASGVLALLEEMRHAGLYFDKDSRALVNVIQHAYSQAEMRIVGGAFKSKLMEMPEYEPLARRLSHWVSHIDRSIKEKSDREKLRRPVLGFQRMPQN